MFISISSVKIEIKLFNTHDVKSTSIFFRIIINLIDYSIFDIDKVYEKQTFWWQKFALILYA